MNQYNRVWAEIDLDAVLENINCIKKVIKPGTKIMCVIKTDGYGHGAAAIAELLEQEDAVFGYAVATAEEALQLRKKGIQKPFLVLGYTFPENYEELILNDIRPTVFTEEMLSELSDAARRVHKDCLVHIKVDTGMSRIGIFPDESGLDFIKKASQTQHIQIEGIFTHFSKADETDKTCAFQQLHIFQSFLKAIDTCGIQIPIKHCANSAAIMEMPEANMDMVRAGIILYGLWPSNEVDKSRLPIKPVLSLKSRVVYVKTLPKGQEISYGGTYVTQRETRIATISVGYGDGYPRSLSNQGYVLIHGQRAMITGRVCMDQFMVDITDIKEPVKVGDLVTLIGQDQDEVITMEALGDLAGRFNYELACDLSKRIPRIMKKDGTLIRES